MNPYKINSFYEEFLTIWENSKETIGVSINTINYTEFQNGKYEIPIYLINKWKNKLKEIPNTFLFHVNMTKYRKRLFKINFYDFLVQYIEMYNLFTMIVPGFYIGTSFEIFDKNIALLMDKFIYWIDIFKNDTSEGDRLLSMIRTFGFEIEKLSFKNIEI